MKSRKVLGWIAALAFIPAADMAQDFGGAPPPGGDFPPTNGIGDGFGDDGTTAELMMDILAEKFSCEKF